MKKLLIAIILLSFSTGKLTSQDNQIKSSNYLQGFQKRIDGNTIIYNSPQPDVDQALLGRARTEFRSIEWETEPVRAIISGDFVNFIWIFGIDVNAESHPWDLLVNGTKYLTFYNPKSNEKSTWTVTGRDGSEMTFRRTMIDRYDDAFGYTTLKLPKSAIEGFKGKPLTLQVLAEEKGSNVWYMTFMSPVNERVELKQEQVMRKENGKLFYQVDLEAVYLGGKSTGEITIPDITRQKFELFTGFNSVKIKMPVVSKPSNYSAEIKINDKTLKRSFTMNPVKEWTVYFVQHTHTDIGYTRPQTEILPEHLRFIDYALDYCDQTDTFPDDAKFHWTCEAAWAVKEYLKSRPSSQIERLKQRVNEGRIEVTGMYFNMSEIIDETTLSALTRTIQTFNDNGITVKTAMQDDVNGIGWCMADYFPPIGVRYLVMGEHGHRARIPFDKPTAFWWESPSGSRMLAFRGEHYMTGNALGIHMNDMDTFEKNLMKYLSSLENKGYPFPVIELQYSGYVTDNSPPATSACDLVKRWNEEYASPKLRMATMSEFMEYVENNYADELPVYRKAWPDWWSDGTASAARETAAVRQTNDDMIANMALFSMADMLGEKMQPGMQDEFRAVQEDLAFYDEHTYGAAESISDPMAENTMIQWGEKSSYAWEAVKKARMLREEGMGLIQNHLPQSDVPTITVINTLNWQRSGMVKVYIDHEILPENKAFRIADEKGNIAEAQALTSRTDGTYWGLWVHDIPPVGYKTYRIEVLDAERNISVTLESNRTLENNFFKLVIDPNRGAVKSILDKESNKELVDPACEWQMGEFIYERLANRTQLERFTNSNRDTVYRKPEGYKMTLKNVKIEAGSDGPIWKSLIIKGEIPECADDRGITCEIRLYKKEKKIEFCYDLYKLPVVDPEAVYIAFPFDLPAGTLRYEAQGGIVVPGKDQLEGTSSDWNAIQSFAAVKNNDTQIVFSSNEMPLVQFGDINTGKFAYISDPKHPWIFSWPMNNYWTTNFCASQEGELKWSYFITTSPDTTKSFATRFGWGSRIPFLTRVQPAGKMNESLEPISFLNLDFPGVLLVNAKPAEDGNGIILHLREVNGKNAAVPVDGILINCSLKSIEEVNVLEKEVAPIGNEISLKPYEVKFIRIIY